MKVDTLIDSLTALRRQFNENFEVVIIDPTVAQVDQSNWTPEFEPVILPYEHADGRVETITMLVAHADNASIIGGDGVSRPVKGSSNG